MQNPNISNPRRSILYMPGSNARALEKAKSLKADGYIFDLEDAVAPDAKQVARENIVKAIRENDYGNREIVIRVNAIGTPWVHDDIKAACEVGPDAILIPKVEDGETINTIHNLIMGFDAPKTMKIWAMIETPNGVLNAQEIAGSDDILECLVMGTSDLVNDLGARHTVDRAPLYYSLGHAVLAARTTGVSIIDGVHLDLNDDDGYRASCVQGRDFGFDGKSLIHPKQIDMANRIFGPDEDEVDQANQIIAAYEDALSKGDGIALLDGKLIENLHVENAKRTLHMAKIIESRK